MVAHAFSLLGGVVLQPLKVKEAMNQVAGEFTGGGEVAGEAFTEGGIEVDDDFAVSRSGGLGVGEGDDVGGSGVSEEGLVEFGGQAVANEHDGDVAPVRFRGEHEIGQPDDEGLDEGGEAVAPLPVGKVDAQGSISGRGFAIPGFSALGLVGVDDSLDEGVTDDVLLVEFDDGDALNVSEGTAGFEEAGNLMSGEVNLGEVAGNHAFRVESEASEEHEHLFGGGILGFVKDDKGLIEGSSAHVGEGCDFDDALGNAAVNVGGVHHVIEGVVEGAKIREDLLVGIPGEVPEAFARFDGGPGKDNAIDLLVEEAGNGHGHRLIGFAGSGGTDAEDAIVIPDGVEVTELAEGTGEDGRFAGGDIDAVGVEFFEVDFAAFDKRAEGKVEAGFTEDNALVSGIAKGFKKPDGSIEVGLLAGEGEPGVAGGEGNVKGGFNPGEEVVFSSGEFLCLAWIVELKVGF